MSNALVGMLRAVLSLETGAFEKGASRAEKRTKALERSMAAFGKKLRNVGGALTAAISAPVAGLSALSVRSADTMIELDQMAKLAGLSAGRFKVLALTASQFGIEQDKLSDILKDVNDRVGDFIQTGGGPMADFFEKIAPKVGITKDAFVGLNSEQALGLYIKSLRDANVSQQEMTFYMEALASDATALVPMFEDNGRAIQVMTDKARELGLVLDEKTIVAAKASREEFRLVGEILRTKLQAALVGLIPVFTTMAEAAIPVLKSVTDKLRDLAEWFQSLSPRAQKFAAATVGIAAAIGPVVAGLGLMTIALAPMAGALAAIAIPAAAVGVAIGALWLAMQDGEGLLGRIGDAMRKVPFVAMAVASVKAALGVADFVKATGGLQGAIVALKAMVVEVAGRLDAAWGSVKQSAIASFNDLKAGALEALAGIIDGLPDIANPIVGTFVGAKDAVVAAWDALPGAFKAIGQRALNSLIDAMQSGLSGLVEAVNGFLSAVHLPTIAPPDLSEWKVSVEEATGAASAARDAFSAAFKADYTGPMSSGLRSVAEEARGVATVAREAFGEMAKAAGAPLQTVEALSEAQRMLAIDARRGAADTTDALDDATNAATNLENKLKSAADAGEDLGGSGAKGARKLKEELDAAKSAAAETSQALAGIGSNFLDSVISGDVSGGISGLWDGFTSMASQSLSGALFSPDGFGAGFATAAQNFTTGISALAAGGEAVTALGGTFGALSTAISGAMPYIGLALTAFQLIKGFSSTEKIGGGLDLGISGGNIVGNKFERFKKSTFWGLFKTKYDEKDALPRALKTSLQRRVDQVQDGVVGVFRDLGVSWPRQIVSQVRLKIRRIDTSKLSENEVAAKIEAVFADYANALSRAIGNIGTVAGQMLLQVQNILSPIGKSFDLFAGQSTRAGVVNLEKFARAAGALVRLTGGADSLASKTSAFFETYYTDAEKLDVMRTQVGNTFGELGLAIPKTNAEFKSLVLSQNLLRASGRKAYAALIDIAPVFDQITASATAMRDAYSLDATGFTSEWEAKLADEIRNPGRYDAQLISTQNAELARQTSLLEEIKRVLGKSNQTADDAILASLMT